MCGFVNHFEHQFGKLVDAVCLLCYSLRMKAKPLSEMNRFGLTRAQIVRLTGLSYTVVDKMMNVEKRMARRFSLDAYISIVRAFHPDTWQDIRLGSLFSFDDEGEQ
jgi:hypothetical protein